MHDKSRTARIRLSSQRAFYPTDGKNLTDPIVPSIVMTKPMSKSSKSGSRLFREPQMVGSRQAGLDRMDLRGRGESRRCE